MASVGVFLPLFLPLVILACGLRSGWMSSLTVAAAGIAVTVLGSAYVSRRRLVAKINKLDPKADADAIYHLLGCFEFPWEAFYGINFAFYRTFSSPTISGLYHSTRTIEDTSGKRVNDTDIIMHAWFDHGVDSPIGRASWEHLNKIHGNFAGKHKNYDFVYVLCCFIADTIRFINVFGWRTLTKLEEEAIYQFWIRVGQRMNLTDMPGSLPEAVQLVHDYVESDKFSKETIGGRALTAAITKLITEWYWFVPAFILRPGVTALLYVIGGATFVRKLGLGSPNGFLVGLLYVFGTVRAWYMMFVFPRTKAHRLSEHLLKSDYSQPASVPVEEKFVGVGPVDVLARIRGA
eukprot:TRINITY_DN6200_c0_g1_i1.p1 TRINITY_DN6200_c0_g1~~TRINITY_DN6200_c0_g1_i1.p1  ORF type:complete len:363 (+),score=47.95 TRINITY_DN6200_c0_g1_i1:48-1091(+)